MNTQNWQPYREHIVPPELQPDKAVDVSLPDCAMCGRKIQPRKDKDNKEMRRDDGSIILNGFVRIGAKKAIRICYKCACRS